MKVGDLVRLNKRPHLDPKKLWIITDISVIRMSEGGVKVAIKLNGCEGMVPIGSEIWR